MEDQGGGGQRIPSLDGLRAMSICFVLLGHLVGTQGFPGVGRVVPGTLAAFGVRVFFVISGFLITSLLIQEEQKTGKISLRHFYLRRTLRIFPPFYAFVGLMALASAVHLIHLRRFDLLAAMTYTTNYHHNRAWFLGHAWSLAVEEQFYLLWPFVVTFLGSKRASIIALGAVLVCPILRLALMTFTPSLRPGIGETFATVADSIATGCLLACWRGRLDAWPRLAAFLRGRWFWIVPGVALAAAFTPSAKLECFVGQTVANVGIALLIDRVVRFSESAPGRLLNARPVVFVGMLSYSLYLWQQPFLDHDDHMTINRFPLNIVLAVGAALTSYYLVERPALRLRSRLEKLLFSSRKSKEAPQALPL
jgi:peptidoglycan/LPS O-acetylase OafA/YrhL